MDEYVDVPLLVDDCDAPEDKQQTDVQQTEPQASTSGVERISGIPVTTMQTFKALQQRRLEMSAKAAQKMAKLSTKKLKRCKKSKLSKNDMDAKESETEKKWTEVRKYLDVNSHLTGPVSHGVGDPKSGMEVRVNEAIAQGNSERAEQLSDQLAAREFGVRAAQAFAAKRFLDEKEETHKKQLMKAKIKLHWGFEAKQRWEMKGNM